MRARAKIAPVGFFAVLGAFAACGRRGDDRPVAAIATSPESEAKFDGIRVRWADSTPKSRAAMRDELEKALRELEAKGDGLEPIARAYLAISWLDAGVPAAAEAVARPLVEGPPGVPNDLGVLVKGAAARRQGRAAEAIELLRPLVGKLIDVFARPILYEEITEAFLDEQRWDDAIVYAEGWLRSVSSGSPAEQKQVKQAVARVLARVPEQVALKVLEAEASAPPEARHSPDLIVILAARVEAGSNVAAGDAGTVDANFAATEYDAALPTPTAIPTLAPVRFDPRTVALLVPSSVAALAGTSSAIVRAAAAVATPGVGDALHGDAGGDAMSGPTGHRLAVFDTGGTALGLQKALDLAERDGAAVVIGGVTDLEANALAALGQTRRIATVLLRRPTTLPAIAAGEKQAWIAVGPARDEERKAALAVAQTASGELAIVEPASLTATAEESADPLHARCDAQPKFAGGQAFPVEAWHARKVANVIVLGDARCARRVAEEMGQVKGWKPNLILAPDALEAAHWVLPVSRTVIGAGLLPAGNDAPSSLKALWIDQAGPVGWEGGLGHDAAVLATWALPGDLLPATETAAREKARAITISRLLGARGELWTATANSPEKNGVVARSTSTRSVAAGAAIVPTWAP